jgi:hypothetical protein
MTLIASRIDWRPPNVNDYIRSSAGRIRRGQVSLKPILASALLLFTLAKQAFSQHNPFTGAGDYPQYRVLSGLAGGGYGVDERGYGSLSGPTAFSTPIAYVLGRDQFEIGITKTSFSLSPNFGNQASNGKGIITYGHTFGQFNLMATDLFKSTGLDQAYNLQIAYMPSARARLVPSIGVQDVLGLGGSAGEGLPTDKYSSRSVFGVVTYRLDTGRRPVYLSIGGGTHRFSNSFESVSYQVNRPMRVWLEYDGYGINEGALFAFRLGGRRAPILNTVVGLVRTQYLTIGAILGF